MFTTYVLRRLGLEIHITVKWDNLLLSSVVNALLLVLETQCTTRLSCCQVIMEDACNMLLTLGACSGLAGHAARPTRYVIVVSVIQTLMESLCRILFHLVCV
jgi:hypothetical protein